MALLDELVDESRSMWGGTRNSRRVVERGASFSRRWRRNFCFRSISDSREEGEKKAASLRPGQPAQIYEAIKRCSQERR